MTATAITPCHQQRASKAVLQIALTSSPDNHPKTWGLSFSRLHRRHTRFEGSDGRARTRSHPSSQGRRKIPEIFILVLPPPLTLCSGGLQTSPAQGQTITVFRCAGQIISATTPLCHCSTHGGGHGQPVRELDLQQRARTEFGPWDILCQAWFQIAET